MYILTRCIQSEGFASTLNISSGHLEKRMPLYI